MKEISTEDLKRLTDAKNKLENVGLIMHGINFIGTPIEKGMAMLPAKRKQWLATKTNSVLMSVVAANLKTMAKSGSSKPLKKTYKATVTASGIGSGFFGAVGFVFDLGITTKFIMRSILDIARSKGEDITSVETQMSCLSVFALGGKSKDDDAAETSYYATRIALRSSIAKASEYAATNVTTEVIEKFIASNTFVKLVSQIASRFGVQVTEKFVAEAVPVAGAVGGGAINLIFMSHFQRMAEGHFTVRELERKYGEEVIRKKYQEIKVN